MFNGIDIIQDDEIVKYKTDKNGYYIQPCINNLFEVQSLENLNRDEITVTNIISARENFLKAGLREVYAYNMSIDLTSDVTGVDLSMFKLPDIERLEFQVNSLNYLIMMLFDKITNHHKYVLDKSVLEN